MDLDGGKKGEVVLLVYFINIMKTPNLKLRYAKGLGDVIACLLHSKAIGWLTHAITGQDKPCEMCSIRITALNTLLPIPVWRLFFKNQETLLESMAKDYKDNGYEVVVDGLSLSAIKPEIPPSLQGPQQTYIESDIPFEYDLVSTSETTTGDFLIKVEIFRKK
jgi:hypothetical protein